MSLFEQEIPAFIEDIEFTLNAFSQIEWSEFLLNPRRLRGSDFLMRWSQGVWSEERLTETLNCSNDFFALPYGPSGVAPDNDVREFELYFERLEAAGLGNLKRPDLLIFQKNVEDDVNEIIESLGGTQELPFISEDNQQIQNLLSKSLIAVECENSLWKAQMMPDYGVELKPQKRLDGKLGLKKSAVLPTIIIKEQDRQPLLDWQNQQGVKIHVWHSFYDLAFGLSLDKAESLISEGLILPNEQVFQAPGGAVSKKLIYKFYYHYAYPLSESLEEPNLVATHIVDKNGHILPYVRFEGGKMSLKEEALQVLKEIADAKR